VHQVLDGMVSIHEIDDQFAAGLNGSHRRTQGNHIVGFGIKIPKAGKKIYDQVEIRRPENIAHIVPVKMQMLIFKMPGVSNIPLRQIETGNVKAFLIEINRMPAFAAGQIHNSVIGFGLQVPY
jgi:hypothetical protein